MITFALSLLLVFKVRQACASVMADVLGCTVLFALQSMCTDMWCGVVWVASTAFTVGRDLIQLPVVHPALPQAVAGPAGKRLLSQLQLQAAAPGTNE
jgi:hypothetical protein